MQRVPRRLGCLARHEEIERKVAQLLALVEEGVALAAQLALPDVYGLL